MNGFVVNIESIEINNFKNVKHGFIDLKRSPDLYGSDILGVYGQNGSGKTALIDAIELLKLLLSGKRVPVRFADFINVDSQHANLKFTFSVINDGSEQVYKVIYEFNICKEYDMSEQNIEYKNELDGKYKATIFDEIISYSFRDSTHQLRLTPIVNTKTEGIFIPKTKYLELMGNDETTNTNLLACKKLTSATSQSFIFSKDFLGTVMKNCKIKYHRNLFSSLINFGNFELFVINTSASGLISLNALPLNFKYESNGKGTVGSIALNLNDSFLIPQSEFEIVKKVIGNMNIVLKQLVPGLTIGVEELGNRVLKNGEMGSIIQLMSFKNSQSIPLCYESEGIKKIVSILQLLIVVYNDPSITVAIDELDSGVFEYLLGELLKIISEKGKGQLIFTSHNLRPLETINHKCIIFTTVNPENRYIRLKNIKSNNNLRTMYYRDITLKIQKQPIYDSTNNNEIAHSFREAGELIGR